MAQATQDKKDSEKRRQTTEDGSRKGKSKINGSTLSTTLKTGLLTIHCGGEKINVPYLPYVGNITTMSRRLF